MFCLKCGKELIQKQDSEGKIRLACSVCSHIHYDNPVPVVGALVEHEDGNIIMVQNIGWPKNWFGLVTGFLEKGENPEAGILREIKEEIGISDAKIQSLIGVYSMEKRNEIIICYHVKTRGEIVIAPNEIAAYRRTPISQLRGWNFGTGLAIRDWLQRRQESAGIQSRL